MAVKSPPTVDPVFVDSTNLQIPTLRILQADGSVIKGAQPPELTQELAQKIYRDMVYTRILDERMVGAQRQGRPA